MSFTRVLSKYSLWQTNPIVDLFRSVLHLLPVLINLDDTYKLWSCHTTPMSHCVLYYISRFKCRSMIDVGLPPQCSTDSHGQAGALVFANRALPLGRLMNSLASFISSELDYRTQLHCIQAVGFVYNNFLKTINGTF